jgi:hypothetical protein
LGYEGVGAREGKEDFKVKISISLRVTQWFSYYEGAGKKYFNKFPNIKITI